MAEEFGAPITDESDSKRKVWIIVVVVVVVLLCCCVISSAGGWYFWEYGDDLFGLVSNYSNTLL